MTLWYKYLLLYLWIAPHVLLLGLAIFLLNRRLFKQFPAFVLYTWYEIAEFVVLFAIAISGLGRGPWYLRLYLVTLAISTALRFGVIQEIFNHVFREQGPVAALARVALRWTTIFLLAVGVLCALFASGHSTASLIAGASWLGRGIAIVQCGLLLFLFLFSRLLGVSLQSYVFGIALGFGILSSVELANWALHASDLSESMARTLNLLPTAGYHVAVLLWLGYLLVPVITRPRQLATADGLNLSPHIDQWNQELERFLQ